MFQSHSRVCYLDDLNHELLVPYRELRTRNWTRQSGIFIAEGPLLVERLLQSGYSVESVLLDRKYAETHWHWIPQSVPVLLIEHDLVQQLVGFNFHRGVLGCGRRPEPKRLLEVTRTIESHEIWLALIGVQDPENVGSMLRSAAGLGVNHILIGPGTADPLSRRALRVSMGNSLRLETYYSSNIHHELEILKRMGLERIATTPDVSAEPLESVVRGGPLVLLVGNERHGLPKELIALTDRKVSIPMALDTDSLNVAVAAGIVMHYFSRLANN